MDDNPIMFSSCLPPAAGVDPSDHPLAGEPNPGEDCKRYAGQAGGLQRLPLCPQTPQGIEYLLQTPRNMHGNIPSPAPCAS